MAVGTVVGPGVAGGGHDAHAFHEGLGEQGVQEHQIGGCVGLHVRLALPPAGAEHLCLVVGDDPSVGVVEAGVVVVGGVGAAGTFVDHDPGTGGDGLGQLDVQGHLLRAVGVIKGVGGTAVDGHRQGRRRGQVESCVVCGDVRLVEVAELEEGDGLAGAGDGHGGADAAGRLAVDGAEVVGGADLVGAYLPGGRGRDLRVPGPCDGLAERRWRRAEGRADVPRCDTGAGGCGGQTDVHGPRGRGGTIAAQADHGADERGQPGGQPGRGGVGEVLQAPAVAVADEGGAECRLDLGGGAG